MSQFHLLSGLQARRTEARGRCSNVLGPDRTKDSANARWYRGLRLPGPRFVRVSCCSLACRGLAEILAGLKAHFADLPVIAVLTCGTVQADHFLPVWDVFFWVVALIVTDLSCLDILNPPQ